MDKIIISGNLGRDPEMRYTPSGRPVTNFSVAANRRYTDSEGERHESVVWYRISVWGKMAEACNQYLVKGQAVVLEGRLQADAETGSPRIWTDQEGNPRASFEVTAQTVEFGRKPGGQKAKDPEEDFVGSEEIPF